MAMANSYNGYSMKLHMTCQGERCFKAIHLVNMVHMYWHCERPVMRPYEFTLWSLTIIIHFNEKIWLLPHTYDIKSQYTSQCL